MPLLDARRLRIGQHIPGRDYRRMLSDQIFLDAYRAMTNTREAIQMIGAQLVICGIRRSADKRLNSR